MIVSRLSSICGYLDNSVRYYYLDTMYLQTKIIILRMGISCNYHFSKKNSIITNVLIMMILITITDVIMRIIYFIYLVIFICDLFKKRENFNVNAV